MRQSGTRGASGPQVREGSVGQAGNSGFVLSR